MNHEFFLIVFAVTFILLFVAFGMQRATLLMSRQAGVPPQFIAELLLPSWFPIVVLLLRLAKWGTLFYIAFTWSWILAAGLLCGDFILSGFLLPIPYSMYVPSFRSRIRKIEANNIEVAHSLEEVLNLLILHGW